MQQGETMKIKTERLVLREKNKKTLKKEDIDDITEGIGDIEVSKWLLVVPHPYAKKDAKQWLSAKKKKDTIDLLIELAEEKKVIGAISIMRIKESSGVAEVGYWLNTHYHKKGYGSEALAAVLDYAFNTLKLRRIEAGVLGGNPSSGKLLEKFGAVQEGIKRQAVISKASRKIHDELIYGILEKDYFDALKNYRK